MAHTNNSNQWKTIEWYECKYEIQIEDFRGWSISKNWRHLLRFHAADCRNLVYYWRTDPIDEQWHLYQSGKKGVHFCINTKKATSIANFVFILIEAAIRNNDCRYSVDEVRYTNIHCLSFSLYSPFKNSLLIRKKNLVRYSIMASHWSSQICLLRTKEYRESSSRLVRLTSVKNISVCFLRSVSYW